jgi:hypothetical protein
MTFKFKAVGLLAAVAIASMAAPAQAVVFDIGGTVNFQYFSAGGALNVGSSPTTFATPGSINFLGDVIVTASGDQLVYTFNATGTFTPQPTSLNSGGLFITQGPLISSVSGIPAFTSVTLDASSILGSSGFTASDVTFNSTAVAVSWGGLFFQAGDKVVLDVNTVSTTPLPPAWTMMLMGIAGLGFMAFRKNSRPALLSAA